MRTMSMVVVLSLSVMACGGAGREAQGPVLALASLPTTMADDQGEGVATAQQLDAPEAQPALDTSALPAPPWSEEPIGSDVAPSPILSAWTRAENRAECAPMAPRALGAGEGARARVADLEGGWAVEFDRRGMPGLGRDGQTCARCGHGVFGIAGTSLTPEDLAAESEADAPAPTFADGSSLSIEPPAEGEQVAAATFTVRGQGCVYQVWSFLGEEHVRELVSSLRIVEVAPRPARVASR